MCPVDLNGPGPEHATGSRQEVSMHVASGRAPMRLFLEVRGGSLAKNQKEERGTERTGIKEKILTEVTVQPGPSLKTVAVISADQIFARARVHAGTRCALVCIWKMSMKKREVRQKGKHGAVRREEGGPQQEAALQSSKKRKQNEPSLLPRPRPSHQHVRISSPFAGF